MRVPNLVPIGPQAATCIPSEGYTHTHTHTDTHTLSYIDIDTFTAQWHPRNEFLARDTADAKSWGCRDKNHNPTLALETLVLQMKNYEWVYQLAVNK